jgi:type IV pilus biogenesis protein CpaD/CtpE
MARGLWQAMAGAALLAGCASQSAPPVTTGTLPQDSMQAESSYRLSFDEHTLDCRSLALLIDQGIPRLKELAAQVNKAESDKSSSFLPTGNFFGSASRPPKGVEEQAQYQRERSRLVAYNAQLAVKQCPTVDLDAKLQGVPVPAEPSGTVPEFRSAPG